MSNVKKIQQSLGALDALLLTDPITIRYAAGFHIDDGAAIIGRDRAWLITDSRYEEAARETVRDMEILSASSGTPFKTLAGHIFAESSFAAVGAEEDRMSRLQWQQMEEDLDVTLQNGASVIAELRQSKSDEELASLIAVQRIAEKALDDLLGILRPGMTEKELAAELVYRLYKFGGEANSFDPIVVTGSKTSMPHGVPGDKVIQPGDFVTMDFGTKYNGYCSDTTRTVAVGHVTDEMRRVYDTVLRAQLAGIEAARPGATGREIDAAARRVIEDAGYGPYFGHSFGHSLGLEIHEAPNAAPRNDKPMPDRAVISAEPGIYIPGRFGVRIEDVLFLHDGGCTDITEAPKELLIL